jgi:hypothetical protein
LISLKIGVKSENMAQQTAHSLEENFVAERRAFERQRSQLMRRYRDEYVALAGGRVIDHDENDEALAVRMFRKLRNKPFYIVRVEERSSVYELPSPR